MSIYDLEYQDFENALGEPSYIDGDEPYLVYKGYHWFINSDLILIVRFCLNSGRLSCLWWWYDHSIANTEFIMNQIHLLPERWQNRILFNLDLFR